MDEPHSPDEEVEEQSKFSNYEYRSHTLRFGLKARHKILPCFPPNSTSKLQARQPRPIASTVTTVSFYPEEEIHFLLCNIPGK